MQLFSDRMTTVQILVRKLGSLNFLDYFVSEAMTCCSIIDYFNNVLIFVVKMPVCFEGATRTAQAKEIAYARQHIVMVAKAFKLQAIDIVYIDLKGINYFNCI